ncbi:hypothetical protein A2875_01070 [Candidatus Gottesmanbacteria bacterium RIFCSPHIGHO2_01_FULL_46_14]|uniref:Uncharacterized protein n=1 Tax=Candidatus Gottesmanbacteria bacterium RIFCSPHIGHO2_01_FULL_46_14 TaxID=1798380 RepID=A0A1F5ZMN0_9BACT|nr:MAG: hypothetical protein A2875_01070 [Candidatus Gottesmanbacteria bacterium RIFCSPHIGHO2_01_FULL_46_14]
MNNFEFQPIRIDRVAQPPFIDVPIYGPRRYQDPRFDEIFNGAEKDRKRPEGFHPGWWVIHREYIRQATKSGILLTELPLRYEEELEPLSYLAKIVRANNDPDAFESLYAAYLTFMPSKWYLFERYKPERKLVEAVGRFHNDVVKFDAFKMWKI